MPFLSLLLTGCALLLATCGSGSPTSPSQAPQSTGGRPFKVMTFNIQHGIDGTDQYNLQRAIDVIAKIEPDLVGVQEITRNHPKYRCEDQPAVMADGLRRATGRAWTHVYVQEWWTKDQSCMASGRGDGPETEGLAFLAPAPLGAVTHTKLYNSRIGLAVRPGEGRQVSVIVTHLTNGAKNAGDRTKQVAQLLPFGDAQGVPRLMIGDLNADASSPELEPLMRVYRDAWADATQAGTTRGAADGSTRASGSGRIDYILYVPDTSMQLEWAQTVDTRELIGMDASDHRPVVASFKLR